VVVDDVVPQSPAAAAGLKPGDVLVELGKRVVTNRFDVERALWGCKPGDRVEAAILRAGKSTRLDLRLGRTDAERVAAVGHE
jgi:serine protease Do